MAQVNLRIEKGQKRYDDTCALIDNTTKTQIKKIQAECIENKKKLQDEIVSEILKA